MDDNEKSQNSPGEEERRTKARTSSNTDQTSRNSKLELILLSEERHNFTSNRSALNPSLRVLGNNSRPNLNLLPNLSSTIPPQKMVSFFSVVKQGDTDAPLKPPSINFHQRRHPSNPAPPLRAC